MSISLIRLTASFTSPFGRWPTSSWVRALMRKLAGRARPVPLDLDNAPEPLLRDLGILDGRGPKLREPGHPGWR